MDKLYEYDTKEEVKSEKRGIFSHIREAIARAKDEKSNDRYALACDLILFTVGFLLSRCHLLFAARPLGIAFVAALPLGVWPALFGAVLGALTLGIDGMVLAGATAIVVFLRAALSVGGSQANPTSNLFSESLLLRMCVSIIGGFLAALYEVIAGGFNETTLIFGLAMIILPPILTFVFSGAFSSGITLRELISGGDIFSVSGEQQRYNVIFFQISALTFLFFISLSLEAVNIFGISLSYIFSSLATLLVAKRFGALRGLTAGFVTSLGISGTLSVSFALAGLGSGIMFGFGTGYAIIAGGAALCAWSAYASGLSGFLATFPEYVIAASLALPMLKRVGASEINEKTLESCNESEDMVGTMALAYQNKFSGSLDSLEIALSSLSGVIRDYSERSREPMTLDDYRDVVITVAERYCSECGGASLCAKEEIRPCIKNADLIAEKLASGKRILGSDVNTDTEFCQHAGEVAEAINIESARREMEIYRPKSSVLADEYELIAKLLNTARATDDVERTVDDNLTEPLSEIFARHGFESGTIRAFGERRRHFILAGEDRDGRKITSPELRRDIEDAIGVKLDTPDYFRRDDMVLMECGIRRSIAVEVATASRAGDEKEISGDTIACFESGEDRFYSLISDGMGSGKLARETSEFVTKFMRTVLDVGTAKDTLLHILNHTIRSQSEECSATVDLFEIDLLTGEATFIKSGAAPSYVKRESSIFRIRSQTAPIGLLGSIDSEKIKVEVRPGDYVVMLSDGIADSMEDAPWLLLLLGEPPKENLEEYARLILDEAVKNAKTSDDMSVVIIKIKEA
ncbi:MAG: SpoIIE family protein phosphatase [Clostridia bacterium]|nr:SpoIIE family protein phosphatase [Clostridia bacterium]